MAEYIEREATLKDLELLAKYQHGERQQGILGVCETIKRKPAADVVEVVRCQDCKHFTTNLEDDIFSGNDTFCEHPNGLIEPRETDFCSYGERRAE